jgi:hypothetical protein
MEPLEKYWKLMRLNPSGDASAIDRPPALQHLTTECHDLITADPLNNRHLQSHLTQQLHQHSLPAALCLRSFASHHILMSCLKFVSMYGSHYHFRLADIAHVTLNDDGELGIEITHENGKLSIQRSAKYATKDGQRFKPLAFQILEKFDPTKAGLGVWASRLTWQDSKFRKLLHDEFKFLIITDWALLNDTKPETLKRMLIKNFNFPDLVRDQARNVNIDSSIYQSELQKLQELTIILQAYHEVYRFDRQNKIIQPTPNSLSKPSKSSRGQSCSDPTPEQYDRMIAKLHPLLPSTTALSEELIQEKLRTIADYIRRHRLKQLPTDHIEESTSSEIDNIPNEILLLFDQYLHLAIGKTIKNRLTGPRVKAKKAEMLIKILKLTYQKGLSQDDVAKQLNLPGQYTVARILSFKLLITGIIGHMSEQLKNDTPSLAEYFNDADRLLALQDQLESYLRYIFSKNAKERSTPIRNRHDRSQLSEIICDFLTQHYPD